ncbi:mitochondrial ribosomal protein L17 [Neolentinus lepideus HHB14362 ss-1]|uniref:Mitochondrial ribosomal protein L17 n=1 Tax=Neolentinus lepideus HHB14362 ss-1 TaxID=1314782 RepID=A0A165W0X8_9AGAM|nr:mitochondrial ribosomal protein L17 [Neolentinus lepideus HHB14362 ss-1]
MKHGVAFRKFSRTSSHRMLMLRNLVTSLLEHEQIKTTLPKARDTARLAEKIITLGKKGTVPAYRQAQGFVLNQTLLPKLFGDLSRRYAKRLGGYTRIHKYGNRPGDNAPVAILELVDNPRDLKFELAARSIGYELLSKEVQTQSHQHLLESGLPSAEETVEKELLLGPDARGSLRPYTRINVQKVLKYRDEEAKKEFIRKADDHVQTLMSDPNSLRGEVQVPSADGKKEIATFGRLDKAGKTLPGMVRGAMRLAKGALAKPHWNSQPWRQRQKLGIDRSLVDLRSTLSSSAAQADA